jgi:hypothetical protein
MTARCDYNTGMFSRSPPAPAPTDDAGRMLAHLNDLSVVQAHEAGHAVLQYALGFGCRGIFLTEDRTLGLSGPQVQRSGECLPKKDRGQRLARRFLKGTLDATAIAFGVTVAAGPGAERKFRCLAGLPMDMLGRTGGDHHMIETVAKALAEKGGHDRFAYQEEVWLRAQEAMEDSVIWSAVEALTEELWDYWACPDDNAAALGVFTGTLPGPRAREIMRRAGVRPASPC